MSESILTNMFYDRSNRFLYPFVFLNVPATTQIYTLSLHDALPIFRHCAGDGVREIRIVHRAVRICAEVMNAMTEVGEKLLQRSEEHTSELQSQSNLVCRLLLEKKK